MKKYLSSIVLLAAYCAYELAPDKVSIPFLICTIAVFIVFIVAIYKEDAINNNKLSINILFIPMLFIVSFMIPLYEIFSNWDNTNWITLYDSSYICKGSALVVMAITAYYLGYQKKTICKNTNIKVDNTQVIILNILMILSSVVFIVYMLTTDIKGNDIDGYIVSLIVPIYCITLFCSCLCFNPKTFWQFIKINNIILIQYTFVIIIMLILGDRTLPLTLILILFFIYNKHVKELSIKFLIVSALFGFIFFSLISQTRNSKKDLRSVGFIEFGVNGFNNISNSDEFIGNFQDLIPANSVLYLSQKYIDNNNGYFLPSRFLMTIISPIPLLPSTISYALYHRSIEEISSAYCVTEYNKQIYARNSTSGIGTHIVADIYISWGIIGVIIIFYVFGTITKISQIRYSDKILFSVISILLFSNAIYMVRGTIYSSFRDIVWAIVLYKISYLISQLNKV